MVNARFGFVVARPIALVAVALLLGVACSSGSSGGGTGGSGIAGAGGKGGSGTGGGSFAGSSGSGTGGSSIAGSSGTGTGGGSEVDASGAGGSSEAGSTGTGTGGSSVAGSSGTGTGGSSVAGASGTGGGSVAGSSGSGGSAGGQGGQHDGGADAATDAHADAHTDGGADAKDAESDAGPPACSNACTLGGHRCVGAASSQTCITGSNGCTVWNSGTTCAGATVCAGSTGLCACPAAPAGCSAAGTFCNSSGDVVTCSRDAQGCFSASAPVTCPTDTSCKGSLPSAACTCDDNASCSGTNSFCLSSTTVAKCGSDSNTPACNVVVSTSSCGGSSSCAGGACVCPATGTTAGTGCPALSATICAGTDILTCVTETASGCSIWQASSHCGVSGLTCGKKASGSPACQCPDNSGADVYVDPTGGSDVVGGVFPTGIQSPAACRYATLTNGLTKVGAPGRVIALSATLPASFSGETFPLTIPTGVTVMTADATFTPSDYGIFFTGGANGAVKMSGSAALRGFSVIGSGSAPGLITCMNGSIVLDTVSLTGDGSVTDGVDLGPQCPATLNAVTIADFAGVALDTIAAGTTTITGGELTASLIGLEQASGTIQASGLHADGNGQYGILLATSSSAAPTLNLDLSSTVSGNGSTGTFAGISVAKGSLTVSNSEVAGNGGIGIELTSASGSHQLTSTTVEGNGAVSGSSFGVSLTAGTLTASGLIVTSNTDSGISVSGGTATLGSSALNQNSGRGLVVSGAGTNVNVTGGTFNNNGQAGILALSGALTVGGAELSSNGTQGLNLTGATGEISGANIHDNAANGVLVNNVNGATVGIDTSTTVTHNGGNGILVDAAPVTGGGANSLTIDTVTVSNNAKFGIYLEGDTGSVGATIKGSTISANGDVGLMIEEGGANTTSEAVQNNDVSGNNTGGNHLAGGILFNTSSTLTSFIGNKVHSNVGDELGFNATPNGGTRWVINPPSLACDATANSLYCYGAGSVGLHVINATATVDAQHVHWTNTPPTSGIDFSGTATVTNPCTVVATTCP